MRIALRLAQRALGETSPNPLVGAVIVKRGKVVGRGWHHRAGEPHAEIEAIRDAERQGHNLRGATIYVSLEPCCTHGRTPPCTDALIAKRFRRVVVAATDPNPRHAGKGYALLRRAGITVDHGIENVAAERMNEFFNHSIMHRTPFVIAKAAMTLDGKIATAHGDSKWITSEASRRHAMTIRQSVDAMIVGVNTVISDDPALTVRLKSEPQAKRRIILDPRGRTPFHAKLVTDAFSGQTTVVTTAAASMRWRNKMGHTVNVIVAPGRSGRIDLSWLLGHLGRENVTSVLVEGGGETTAQFFRARLVNRVAFFYGAKVLGGRAARKGVAGDAMPSAFQLQHVEWERLGPDLFLTARVAGS
jgi:diaminohydroxyphosphoribosylaminopyrimidine deaminase/5-amino-6-(5-phosphoribosylamino)uracil reductase